ncbi:site-specific integrase [Maridesulfovibrio ferrireducens]|uniref:tyrosine-type recombinase/integrase n=1 Tax=Maridesulfovibrio ferrireducens TaxID=246191 RepID=UPI001A21CFC8|nr:site-specific integrase [Maridesulfovibrio ferrireducens]MBI9109940.1 site-specific integrase [Maridesulfovibrio ferrireducens]
MAGAKRIKTNYPGVFFIESVHELTKKIEKVYYVRFRKNGKLVEEKVGRQYRDDMTPAKASKLRAMKIDGDIPTNDEARVAQKAAKEAEHAKWTVGKIWDEYLRQRGEVTKSLRSDINRYNKYLKDQFENYETEELRTIEIDRLRSDLLKKLSPQSTKHVLALLKRIVNFSIKKGLCHAPDPRLLHFEMPKVDNTKTESMTQEQLKAFWRALDEEVDQNAASLLRLALATGMRRGALFALKWEDIDFEERFITLRGEAAKKRKTEKIPMAQLTYDILRQIDQVESEYVFPGHDGSMRTEFVRIARRVRDKAGLPKDFRPLHGLRHTFASLLASSGKVDLYTLQKLLSHGSPQMTQRYAHLADESLRRAASVADDVLGGGD